MKHKNVVITETIKLSVGMLAVLALMLAVYALIGHFSMAVLTGGIVGTVLSVANFFFMGMSLFNITAGEEEAKANLKVRAGYMLRMIILVVVLILAIKYAGCDPIATLIPLLAVRLVLTVEQFIVKSQIVEAQEQAAVAPASAEGEEE